MSNSEIPGISFGLIEQCLFDVSTYVTLYVVHWYLEYGFKALS